MPTIRDERLKRWTEIGDAMSNANWLDARFKMDVLAANFQDVKEAFEKYNGFKAKLEKEYWAKVAIVERNAKKLDNSLARHKYRGGEYESLEWWRTDELYKFVFRLAVHYKMFPEGIIDHRPRGREFPSRVSG